MKRSRFNKDGTLRTRKRKDRLAKETEYNRKSGMSAWQAHKTAWRKLHPM